MQIKEFQEMMRTIYFHRDSKRGENGTFQWLMEEIGELWNAAKGENVQALEDEFADVIAWLASLANLLEIDLEKATLKKYNHKCPKCHKTICICKFSKYL